nr:T9SS type A sorting domain-containing protein [Ignavibacteriaceae bacterium]
NPFNPSTLIRYELPNESSVKLIIYNSLGQVVKELVSEVQQSGYYEVNFNASNLSSGIYFYSISATSTEGSKEFRDVKKLMLLK